MGLLLAQSACYTTSNQKYQEPRRGFSHPMAKPLRAFFSLPSTNHYLTVNSALFHFLESIPQLPPSPHLSVFYHKSLTLTASSFTKSKSLPEGSMSHKNTTARPRKRQALNNRERSLSATSDREKGDNNTNAQKLYGNDIVYSTHDPACDACRFKKVKCDRETPTCLNCHRSDLRCVYSDRGKRTNYTKRLYAPLPHSFLHSTHFGQCCWRSARPLVED